MTADNWRRYDGVPELMLGGIVDLDTDTINMNLYLSTSDVETLSQSTLAEVTDEHAVANGYTTAKPLTSPTLTTSGSTGATLVTWDTNNASWTASSGSIIARFALIWDDTVAVPLDAIMCYSLMDDTPLAVTVTDGNTLTVEINVSGILTLSAGQTA